MDLLDLVHRKDEPCLRVRAKLQDDFSNSPKWRISSGSYCILLLPPQDLLTRHHNPPLVGVSLHA